MKPFVIPAGYASMTLDEFLVSIFNAHEDVEDVLKLITNGTSTEYMTFHTLSVKAHVGLLHIRQRDKTWQLNRKSNMRGTAAQERYVYTLYDTSQSDKDHQYIAYRKFIDMWLDWITVPIDKS